MSGLRRVRQAVFGTPWAIQPDRLEAIAEVIEFQAGGGNLTTEQIRARVGSGKGDPKQGAGIAVLPLYGIVGHRMNQVNDISGAGGTSTEQFGQWFDAALADASVGVIVIDIDSPGGSVSGVSELAEKIYRARGTKPVIAIANSLAASAAYWLGTAADELWVTPSGDVGSVGVYAMHEDRSAMDEAIGIKTTLISAGAFKTEGSPHEPLGDDAREAMQERVNEIYGEFIAAVARHRGIEASDVEERFGQGRIVSARKAVRAGMADQVGSFDTLISKLSKGSSTSRARASLDAPAVVSGSLSNAVGATSTTFAGPMADLRFERTAAVGAAGPRVLPSPESAHEAKEHQMSGLDTSAATVADPAVNAVKQELERMKGLRALAADENVPVATLNRWIDEQASVEAAGRELFAQLKATHAKKTPVGSTIIPLDGGDNGTKHGPFRTLGEQLHAVIAAGSDGGKVDHRLFRVNDMFAGPTGASAGSGPDGGFLIQKDFAADLSAAGTDSGILARQCSVTEIGANSDGLEVTYLDDDNRTDGNRWGGVQVYRAAEAETVTKTKPRVKNWEVRLEDMMGLARVTNRMMRDAAQMGSVFSEAFREVFAFKIDNEIYRGTGSGQCLGVLNAPATVTVAKESGPQTADTIVGANVVKMWARVPARSRARGVWYYNVECEPQLQGMTYGSGNAEQLIFMPAGGLSGAGYATIYGRPAMALEVASAIGDLGDISFLDLSQYKLITKGGIEEAESIHVRFENNEKSLRWVFPINGAPKLDAPQTPAYGSSTVSPFVTLAAR